MATSEIEQWWIDKFQENLGPIRKVAGWTTQQLADELGARDRRCLTWETGKSPMTKTCSISLYVRCSAPRSYVVKTAIWHASSRLWSTIPLSNAFANGAPKSKTRGRCRQCPGQYRLWQRCRQRRHRETQAQCRHIEGFKDCRNGQAHAQHGDAGSRRHHRRIGQWNRRRIITYLMFPDGGPNKR